VIPVEEKGNLVPRLFPPGNEVEEKGPFARKNSLHQTLRCGRNEKLPLIAIITIPLHGLKPWIVVGKQSQGHEKNKVKLVSNY
jgi:hypothetical protein